MKKTVDILLEPADVKIISTDGHIEIAHWHKIIGEGVVEGKKVAILMYKYPHVFTLEPGHPLDHALKQFSIHLEEIGYPAPTAEQWAFIEKKVDEIWKPEVVSAWKEKKRIAKEQAEAEAKAAAERVAAENKARDEVLIQEAMRRFREEQTKGKPG